jgi:hypothetical protein
VPAAPAAHALGPVGRDVWCFAFFLGADFFVGCLDGAVDFAWLCADLGDFEAGLADSVGVAGCTGLAGCVVCFRCVGFAGFAGCVV